MHLTQLNGPTGALAAVSFTAYPQELSSAGMVAAKPIWARLRRRYGCRHEGFRLSQVHSPLGELDPGPSLRPLLESANNQGSGTADGIETKEVQTQSCNGITLALWFHGNERRN